MIRFVLHNVRASQAIIFVLYKTSCFRAAVFVFKVKLLRCISVSYKIIIKNTCTILY